MNICEDCPIRLFNTKSHRLKGVGNPWYNKCIVVPNVDYAAYKNENMAFSRQVEIITDVLSSTGGQVSDIFIVPLIRCNETISCKIDDSTIDRCAKFLYNDIRKYNITNILLLGNSAKRLINKFIEDNLDNCFIHSNIKFYVDYSPFIKYVDENKFATFSTHLLKWYYNSLYFPNSYNYHLL